jgi:hypothetical protein
VRITEGSALDLAKIRTSLELEIIIVIISIIKRKNSAQTIYTVSPGKESFSENTEKPKQIAYSPIKTRETSITLKDWRVI